MRRAAKVPPPGYVMPYPRSRHRVRTAEHHTTDAIGVLEEAAGIFGSNNDLTMIWSRSCGARFLALGAPGHNPRE
jgi:hypothetical protein